MSYATLAVQKPNRKADANRIQLLSVFASSLAFFLGFGAQAMTPYKQALDKKISAYVSEGVITGGAGGRILTLLNLRRQYSAKANIERIVLDQGDQYARPLKGRSGYFHVAIEKKPNRVVIDLNQVQSANVTSESLTRLFKKSPFVSSTSMAFDPEDHSTTVVLNLKFAVAVEVFEKSTANGAGLVIDLKGETSKIQSPMKR